MKYVKQIFLCLISLLFSLLLIACTSKIYEEDIFSPCKKFDAETQRNELGSCYKNVVKNLPKDFDCNSLKSTDSKNFCYITFAKINSDDKWCRLASGKYKAICISEVSLSSTDAKICDQLSGNDKNGCLSNVYTNQALNTSDSSPCYKLKSGRYKCLTSISVLLKNLSLCDDIDKEYTEKDYPLAGARIPRYVCKEWVVKQIAIGSNDVSICNEFKFESGKYLESWVPKALCIEGAATCNKNEKLCDSLNGTEITECKRQVGQITNPDSIPFRDENQKKMWEEEQKNKNNLNCSSREAVIENIRRVI